MNSSAAIIIPARGGSKRVPRKNIRPLGGCPLISYSIGAALEADLGIPVIVSTEDAEIDEISRKAGATVVERPPELAEDAASTESVLFHVLADLENRGDNPDWLVTLPPTSPFRRPETIRKFVREATALPQAQDCLMSVTEDRGDYWRRQNDGTLQRLFPEAPRRQQDRTPLFLENSAIYVSRVDKMKSSGSILGDRVGGIVIDPIEAFDINTENDFRIAEALLLSLPRLRRD